MAIAWIVLVFPIGLMVAGAIRLLETVMPITSPEWAERAALVGIVLAVYSALDFITFGATTSPILGFGHFGFSVLLDAVSVVFLLLISFLAWIILRFSATNLQGEAGEGRFTFRLCVTLAGLVLLVTAGNLVQLSLGWVAITIGVNQLLIFYPQRPGAMRASRKKILFSRAADVALTAGLLLLYLAYGVSDIAGINEAARAGNIPVTALLAALCLAVAAILQSALLPVHGWLIEALETPTPASALIHACVVSAGGFLLIRFADVMLGAPFILAILVIIGSFSALAGSVVMLTQSAAKTALAWSTVSQMGFVVLLCGLGLFPLALLHISAHALYRAHAFLIAAGAGQVIRAEQQLGPVARPTVRNVAWAMGLATATYALIGLTFGFVDESPQSVTVGAILVLGIGCLVAQGFADSAPRKQGLATVRASVLFAATYFTLQWVAQNLTVGALPPTPHAGPLEWMLTVLVLLSFAVVAVVQALLPHWSTRPVVRGLRVHATNGFYLNALTDRYTGNWKADPANKET